MVDDTHLPTNDTPQTVEERIDRLAVAVKEGFDAVDEQLRSLKTDVAGLKTDVAGLKTDVAGLKTDVTEIRATMVTKDYLDERLAALKGDLIVKMRKLDGKSDFIIATLRTRSLMGPEDMRRVREEFQVFPTIPNRGNERHV